MLASRCTRVDSVQPAQPKLRDWAPKGFSGLLGPGRVYVMGQVLELGQEPERVEIQPNSYPTYPPILLGKFYTWENLLINYSFNPLIGLNTIQKNDARVL
jgi:hypothetical protein